MAAVCVTGVNALGHSGFQVGIAKDNVGGFAAQFLRDALDRIRRKLGHSYTSRRRSRERHHVDLGMDGDRLAHGGSVAVDEIEDARRKACVVNDLRKQHRAERRDLTGFQDDGAAGCERRCDLGSNLIQRPVPRRDQSADTDRFAADDPVPHPLLELVVRKHARGFLEMKQRDGRLTLRRKRDRRAHLQGHHPRQLRQARPKTLDDLRKPGQALFDAGYGICRESAARCLDGPIHIGPRTQADLRKDLLRRWVDYSQR